MNSIYEYALLNSMVTAEDGEYLSILEWIEQKISINKILVVDVSYMKNILGPDFVSRDDYAIYTSLKRILREYDIDIRGNFRDGCLKLTYSSLTR